jgi:hypothetical protein
MHIKTFEENTTFNVGDYVRFNKNCSGDNEFKKKIFKISKIDKSSATLLYPDKKNFMVIDLTIKNCLDKISKEEIIANKYNL